MGWRHTPHSEHNCHSLNQFHRPFSNTNGVCRFVGFMIPVVVGSRRPMLNAHPGIYIDLPVAPEFARSTHSLNHAIGLPGQNGGAPERSVPGTAIEYILGKVRGSPQVGQSDTNGWPDVFTGSADHRPGYLMIVRYYPTATTLPGCCRTKDLRSNTPDHSPPIN